ncbi:hypothetical protein R84981_002112 [Carnimonas sp. R-84981]|uniref:YfaZ family outer membrane protein n=1 Tax=Carnimonas bestiolae TaxID=3402172 RepID=UPI003EDBA306
MFTRITTIALASAGLLFGAHQASAFSVAANGGKDTQGISATQNLAPMISSEFGYQHSDYHDSDANLYSAGLMVHPWWTPIADVSAGLRYQYQDTDYGGGGGVGLVVAGFTKTPIPLVSVGAEGSYTPDGLTHGNLSSSWGASAQARVTLMARTYGYVGYRVQKSKFSGEGNHEIFSGPMVGVSVGF